ncbi:MAG: hypothetical protein PHW18_12145 [Sulfuricurvum sp.]|uniref:hypothetical protein n=1 Tax=Sulfuricurvum sp. TaxID=2025608 RepID=UPI00260365DE|nr:hypothetical protein [Sulfuricurvum sp.]MDD2830316.1 hypothetical protein [Sulfuricurvum sp.]MDD4950416.1 hypothetical protein [Sulfuricurvum sp.]
MIIAIPMNGRERVFHQNPCSCTLFALYEVTGDRSNVQYRFLENRLNPWQKHDGEMVNNTEMIECSCDIQKSKDPQHISQHYIILEVIGKVDYVIVDQYCLNTLYTFKNVGIKIHKIPPFIKTAKEALNHFIIGADIADKIQHIHAVS